MEKAVSGLRSLAHGIAIAANVVGTLCVMLMVVVVNYDVIARGFFNSPFLGAVEVVQFAMVAVVFLQLPDVVRVGRLTRSDGFLLLVGHRSPPTAAWMRRVINAVSALFMFIIAVATWPEFVEMWETQDFFGVPGVFTAPWWPVKLIIFLSCALCAIIFALKALLPKEGEPT